ncbi:MAG: fibrillarin-like rRNA/tRNA 2'-O-methyltransferase [Candidatus Aenigmatarchaeota archaeon]|nr:MAG: fibrillarin-like rRNA/tRNA 2'-O-methyltransferase [Candidatus Aenigmarchaeota archaeon]
MKQIFSGVYKKGNNLYTKGKNLEEWNPYKSKPAAAILNGLQNFPVKKWQKILYLGAAHGTTISHFSNIVGEKGIIYGVEVSDKIILKLIDKVRKKKNIVPILEDARFPENYGWVGKVDLVYEDIAQRDQVQILKKNKVFLKEKGIILIALKAKAIDSVREVKEIYREVIEELSKDFEIIETIDLEPYEHDHLFIVGRMK